MKVRKNIKEFYRTNIINDNWGLEEKRRLIIKKIVGQQIAPGLLLISAVVFFTVVKNLHFKLVICTGLLAVFYWWWFYKSILGEKIKKFKGSIINELLTFMEKDLIYRPQEKISRSDFTAGNIVGQEIDKYEGREYLEGKLGSTTLKFSQVIAKGREKGSLKNSKRGKLFEGIVFVAEFESEFEVELFIKANPVERMFEDLSYFRPETACALDSPLPDAEPVNINNSSLEEKLKIWSTDKKKAKSMLTFQLCNKILHLEKEVSRQKQKRFSPKKSKLLKKEIPFCIRGAKLYMAVPLQGQNIFKPRFFFSYTKNFRQLRYYFDILRGVVEIIKELKKMKEESSL